MDNGVGPYAEKGGEGLVAADEEDDGHVFVMLECGAALGGVVLGHDEGRNDDEGKMVFEEVPPAPAIERRYVEDDGARNFA